MEEEIFSTVQSTISNPSLLLPIVAGQALRGSVDGSIYFPSLNFIPKLKEE